MRKNYFFIKFLIILILISCTHTATTVQEEAARPSLANMLKSSNTIYSRHHGWLADLSGLPPPSEVMKMEKRVLNIIRNDKDRDCSSINVHLRAMIFVHFLVFQHIANAQGVYLDENIAYQWAHILAMILKESSGDSTNITSMSGQSIATDRSKTDISNWKKILDPSKVSHIKLTLQTNLGLSQISENQLIFPVPLTQEQKKETEFLEGKEGSLTRQKRSLSVNNAIRDLIWFYQDFSQGRLTQSEFPICALKIDDPEYAQRYKEGIKAALLYCGTEYMFRHADVKRNKELDRKLKKAMASIAYCRLGRPRCDENNNELDMRCFEAWVTLCPALNIDIALLLPLRYFATRYANPVCLDTFKALLNQRPQ